MERDKGEQQSKEIKRHKVEREKEEIKCKETKRHNVEGDKERFILKNPRETKWSYIQSRD